VKFGDLIISVVSPLLMSVVWMQPLDREDLMLFARTASACQGSVRASFVLLLIISPWSSPVCHSWRQNAGQAGLLLWAVQLFLCLLKRFL